MKTKNLLFSGAIALSTILSPTAALLNSTPVFAETPNAGNPDTAPHTISISGAAEGAKYEAYQIFKGSNAGGKELANVSWGSAVDTDAVDAENQRVFEEVYNERTNKVEYTFEGKTAQQWANELKTEEQARAFATKISAVLKADQAVVSAPADKDGKTSIEVTGDGYYLIKDNGTNAKPTEFIMRVVGDVAITPKTENEPDHEKKVQENETNTVSGTPKIVTGDQWNDVADYNIGDDIPFTLAAVAPDMSKYTQYEFEFVDTMDDGLTLDQDSIKVFVNGVQNNDIVSNIVKDEHGFTVTTVLKGKNGEKTIDSIKAGDKITVTFSAKLNAGANLNKVGNENHFVLKYSNNPSTTGKGETAPDDVVVFTYELDLDKVDDKTAPLEGAEFELYKIVHESDGYCSHPGRKALYKDKELNSFST